MLLCINVLPKRYLPNHSECFFLIIFLVMLGILQLHKSRNSFLDFGLFWHLTFRQGHFIRGTFWHKDISALEHFGMGIFLHKWTFLHRDVMVHGYFGTRAPVQKCLYCFAGCTLAQKCPWAVLETTQLELTRTLKNKKTHIRVAWAPYCSTDWATWQLMSKRQ